MTGWILLLAACVVCGALGFALVRSRSVLFGRPQAPDELAGAEPAAREPAPQPRAEAAPGSEPTAERPRDEQLALWASQVAAGTRKMTVATDGCRVTWNRSCKHGHPSWIVYLDYISVDLQDA